MVTGSVNGSAGNGKYSLLSAHQTLMNRLEAESALRVQLHPGEVAVTRQFICISCFAIYKHSISLHITAGVSGDIFPDESVGHHERHVRRSCSGDALFRSVFSAEKNTAPQPEALKEKLNINIPESTFNIPIILDTATLADYLNSKITGRFLKTKLFLQENK